MNKIMTQLEREIGNKLRGVKDLTSFALQAGCNKQTLYKIMNGAQSALYCSFKLGLTLCFLLGIEVGVDDDPNDGK